MPNAHSGSEAIHFRIETERLKALVTNIRLGVLVEDEQRKIALVNQSFSDLFDIPIEVMIGADCAAAAVIVAPRMQDPQGYIARLDELINGHTSAVADEVAFVDGRILERDYVPIAVDSTKLGHLWLFRDVTEYRRLTKLEKAAAVRDELRLVIDTIPGLVWSSLPNGQVELFNRRWSEYTGLALKEGSIWGWEALISPEDLPDLQQRFATGLLAGSPAETEARLRRADGQYRWFLLRAVPLMGKDGVPTRWYGQAIDIDDRKRSEEALQHAQTELSHVSRVTTLGELAASIAHEVNQPLSAMVADASACLNWLNRPEPDLVQMRESLTAIVNDGARAGAVLTRIRALLSRSAVGQKPCSVDHIAHSAVALARPELTRQGIHVELSLGAGAAEVMGDAVELQQVVLNLLLNAGEAARHLEIERRRVLVHSRVEREPDATWVTTSVRDFGVGIDDAKLHQLFSAFYTTKPGGLGMGLSISRSIIERHGGRIWATTNPDCGATFAFSLPAS
jgi:PAS domain S-box-containing protein